MDFIEVARMSAAFCGGLKAGVSDLALKIAQKRVADAKLMNSDIITNTVPFCRRNIMDGTNAWARR